MTDRRVFLDGATMSQDWYKSDLTLYLKQITLNQIPT